MELAEFISLADGFETPNLTLISNDSEELTEEEKHKNLFEKNLDYILENLCDQDELELVEDHIDELIEDACYVERRYNNDILIFFLECFYNDFKLYKGKQRKEICQNIYYFFYSNYEPIYYYLNYGKKHRVLTKKDFQSFRFKNGFGLNPKKLLQFLVDFFKIQVYLVSEKNLIIPKSLEKYNCKSPTLFLDFDHQLWTMYRINKKRYQMDCLF